MAVTLGTVALVTGAGKGIGRALCLLLASKGATVTVVELSEPDGLETVRLIGVEHAKLDKRPFGPGAIFVKCDVSVPEQLFKAFKRHEETFGRLDVCVNNAGIGEFESFDKDVSSDGTGRWRKTIGVNLSAVIDGTRLAIQIMRSNNQSGVIINVASAAGLYPSPGMPIYSGSKGGVVLFSRSLGPLRREGIRVNAFCPEYIFTDLAKSISPRTLATVGGFLAMSTVLKGIMELIEDETKSAESLWISHRRGAEYWPTMEEKAKYEIPPGQRKVQFLVKPVPPKIPKTYKKVVIHQLSSDFRAASKVVTVPLELPLKQNHVLVKNVFAGVNASDVNFSSGRYFSKKMTLPLDAGFEAVGIIAGLGEGVDIPDLVVGCPVATLTYGGFSEFSQVSSKHVILIPLVAPELVAVLTSGLTASIALQEAGRLKRGETVLVTAAAGGTGQFAVQLANLAGCKVIATCGGEEKATLLRNLGVDRVINYREEDVKEVLNKEFPDGVDVIYESVGGEMFTVCLKSLARMGRLIIIGMISQYQGQDGWQPGKYPGLGERILAKSQTVVGFFLNDYTRLWRDHAARLIKLYLDKKLQVKVDPKPFIGVETVTDAVELLHSGRSVGKVVVQLASNDALPQSRL